MAAYTDTLGFSKGSAGFDSRGWPLSKNEVRLDFAKIIAARLAAGAVALAAADTLVVIPVAAGSLVLGGGIEILTAETVNTTGTLGLGTGSAYAAAAPINALGHTSVALAAPVFYATASTVILTLNTAAPTNAIARAYLVLVNCNSG